MKQVSLLLLPNGEGRRAATRGWQMSLSLRSANLAWRAPLLAACVNVAGADGWERRLHLLNKPRDACACAL